MSIALSWYGCYLFSIDTRSARLALDSARLAARKRNGAVVVRDRRGSRRSEEDANRYQEGRTQSLHTDVPVFFLPLSCFLLSGRGPPACHQFPRTSQINYHKVDGLQRQTCLFHFQRPNFFKSWRRQEPWSLLISRRKPFLVSSSFWQLLEFPRTWSQHSHVCPIFA